MRLVTCFALWLLNHFVFGQSDSVIYLKELRVEALAEKNFLPGSGMHILERGLHVVYQNKHVGDVLQLQAPVYFRNYGSNMISGITVRSTGPQHTTVTWNGLSLNHFALGQSDFSLLPAILFDSVFLHAGGSSARYGSGAIGGSLQLANQPLPYNSVKVNVEQGSFGKSAQSIKLNFAKRKFRSLLQVYRQEADNDFPILKTNERQQQANYRFSGFQFNPEYELNKAITFGLATWYHHADRNVQPALGIVNSTNNQQDVLTRSVFYIKVDKENFSFRQNVGRTTDHINYNGSKSTVTRNTWQSDFQYRFNPYIKLDVGTEWQQAKINGTGYPNGLVGEWRADVFASAQLQKRETEVLLNIRKPFIENLETPFIIQSSVEQTVWNSNNVLVKGIASASLNYRAPTLNDRYWINSGNINLKPEYSRNAEAGLSFLHRSISIKSSFFYNLVDNWIQWKPVDQNGLFKPQNVQQVRITGIETKLQFHAIINECRIDALLNYQWAKNIVTKTNAGNEGVKGKTLIYTPEHIASGYVRASYRKFHTQLALQSASQRFTEELNNNVYALPMYGVMDFTVGKQFQSGKHKVTINFSVFNVTNQFYQLYAGFAQPGRNYSCQIQYQL
ncbi:MAG: TonB-dependent receptor [Chryseotalea sp.]